MDGQITVKFKPGARVQEALDLAAANGLQVLSWEPPFDWVLFKVTDGTKAAQKVASLADEPFVAQVGRSALGEFTAFPATPPDDPYWSEQYGWVKSLPDQEPAPVMDL